MNHCRYMLNLKRYVILHLTIKGVYQTLIPDVWKPVKLLIGVPPCLYDKRAESTALTLFYY